MAKYVLEILDGDRAGEVLPVPSEALRIGRKPANDLVLADEKTSGVHAEIVLEGDRHVLRDLGSTNGTFIDQKRVTEVVLSVGDVITVGRLRIKFREEGAAGTPDGEFAMHRLDARRVQRRGGSLALLGLLLVVGAGVGGYLWWQSRGAGSTGGAGPVTRQRPALDVGGNQLANEVAQCESEAGWNLAAQGLSFQPGGRAHTGRGGLEAVRVEDDATDFAIATPAEPLSVFSGRSLELAAHVRTEGAARIGVRAQFASSKDQTLPVFRTGTEIVAASDWQRISATVGVPPGCDQLILELVAVLPDADAVAYVDDVAVTEGGDARPFEHQMAEGGQTVVGTATAFAVRSTEVTLAGIAPATVPDAFAGLHAGGLCVLSDLGSELTVTPGERSVQLEASGVDALQLVFPADSAGQTLARAAVDGPFDDVAAESEHRAVELLLGNQGTRVLVRTAAPVGFAGKLGGGTYRVRIDSGAVELVLGFRAARQAALQLQRMAKTADENRQPGRALDLLRQLRRESPQDREVLGEASTMRAQILARLDDAISRLQNEFGEAEFFNTRGGFERVVRGVDQLVTLYGENNMGGRDLAAQLLEDARARLLAIDGAKHEALRERFGDLGTAFEAAGEPGLAKLVQDYVKKHLGGK